MCRRFLIMVAVIGLVLSSDPLDAVADRVWDTAYFGDIFYYSGDMDLIDVSTNVDGTRNPEAPAIARFKLPRAYIFFANGYSQKEYETLPDEIKTNSLSVIFTYPDGLSYKASVSEYSRQYEVVDGLKVKKLRLLTYTAQIQTSKGSAYELDYVKLPEDRKMPTNYPEKYIGEYDGLKEYRLGDVGSYYYGGEDDVLRRIHCVRKFERARPNKYCKYYTVLNQHLAAVISFVDFRLNGGTKFARDRVVKFREVMCPYVHFD